MTIREIGPGETHAAFRAMQALRTQLEDEAEFVRRVDELQRPEGYRSRLSDYVNQRDREFFAVSDATLTALDDPESVQQVPFLMVARRHIRLVTLAEEQAYEGRV